MRSLCVGIARKLSGTGSVYARSRRGIDAAPIFQRPMKVKSSPCRVRALTITEVLVVVTILALLVLILLPILGGLDEGHHRIKCLSNLKQVGLAFRMWSNDNDDQFPWMTSTNGGTLKFTQSTNVFLHFRAASIGGGHPGKLIIVVVRPHAEGEADLFQV